MCKKDSNTKVILTVRDSDATWWNSWCGFIKQEAERNSLFGLCGHGFFYYLGLGGYLGRKIQAMSIVQKQLLIDYLDSDVAEQALTVRSQIEKLTKKERKIRSCYIKHNLYIQSIVLKENLLVWNVKDGWAPLCKFLGKEVPDGPIPHVNKTGDSKFMEEYCWKSNFMKGVGSELNKNVAILALKTGVVTYVLYKEYKSGGGWLLSFARSIQNNTTGIKVFSNK